MRSHCVQSCRALSGTQNDAKIECAAMVTPSRNNILVTQRKWCKGVSVLANISYRTYMAHFSFMCAKMASVMSSTSDVGSVLQKLAVVELGEEEAAGLPK